MKIKTSDIALIPLIILTMASLLLMIGCQTHKPGLVLDPVGPPPGLSPTSDAIGSLLVFSAFDVNAGFYAVKKRVHTDYEILSRDGSPVRKVHNDTGTILEGPVQVELPSGYYRIVARANGYGEVTVPVAIKGAKTTVVHLEGGGSWRNRAEMIRANAVRLPDGRVVGWRAAPYSSNNP